MEELNIYILTANRKKDVILSFIKEIKGEKEVKLLNDEVMVIPKEYNGDLEQIENYDWIAVKNIDDVIELGSTIPPRAFSCYIGIVNNNISGIILGFTIDNYLIIGCSLPNNDVNYEYSKKLLEELFLKYEGILGGVFVEQNPAISKKMFKKQIGENSLFSI
jgi:hypothetical protein